MDDLLKVLALLKDPSIILAALVIWLQFRAAEKRESALTAEVGKLSQVTAGLAAIVNLCHSRHGGGQ